VADRCAQWVDALMPGKPAFHDFTIPDKARGVGLTEAPRGALGHWLDIDNHKIRHYQCVVPTTWNCSPRDKNDQPGALEQALVNTPITDEKNPIEAVRVVRSFDPCIACAVH
jgi:Ni,Fe-hydrogenase I large subunit